MLAHLGEDVARREARALGALPDDERAAMRFVRAYWALDSSVVRYVRETGTSDDLRRRCGRELVSVLDAAHDYEEIARRSLATHWDARSAEERDEIVRLMRLRSLREHVARFDEDRPGMLEIVRMSASGRGDDGVVVEAEVQRRAPHDRAAWNVRVVGEMWKLLTLERADFSFDPDATIWPDRYIEAHGWEGLRAWLAQRGMSEPLPESSGPFVCPAIAPDLITELRAAAADVPIGAEASE